MIVTRYDYIIENDLDPCYIDKRDCPCSVIFKASWSETFEDYYCDFPRIFVRMDIENENPFNPSFLIQLCPRKRLRILSNHFYSVRESIEMGKLLREINNDDMIYSASRMEEVTLIQKTKTANEIPLIKTKTGSIEKAIPRYLKPISQAKQYAEIELNSKKDQKIIECLVLDAKELGFRVEKEEKESFVRIRIYCENQEHLNTFINLYGKYHLLS